MKRMLFCLTLVVTPLVSCVPPGTIHQTPGPTGPLLAGLSIDGCTLEPGFSSAVTFYSVGVGDTVAEAVVRPVTEETGDVLGYGFAPSDPLQVWPADNKILLPGGAADLSISVTRAGMTPERTVYTVRMNRVSAARTIRYVSVSTGSDSTGNGSRDKPWQTIGAALTSISSADLPAEVRIAAGTYPIASTLAPPAGVSLKGGYRADNWDDRKIAAADRDNPLYRTVIACPGSTAYMYNGALSFGNGTTADTLVEGLVIIGGDGSRAECYGLSCTGNAAPTVQDCTVTGKEGSGTSTTRACALYLTGTGRPVFRRCLISGGRARYTAYGVYSSSSSGGFSLYECVVAGSAVDAGGTSLQAFGVYASGGAFVIDRTSVTGSRDAAVYYSYGLYAQSASCAVTNSTLAAEDAGLVATRYRKGAYFSNATLAVPFSGNTVIAGDAPGAVALTLDLTTGEVSGNTILCEGAGGGYGMYLYRTAGVTADLLVTGNTVRVTAAGDANNACGVDAPTAVGGTFSDNTLQITASGAGGHATGIDIESGSMTFSGNTIAVTGSGNAQGVIVYNINSSGGNTAIVSDNVISCRAGNVGTGVYCQGSPVKAVFDGNTITVVNTSMNADPYGDTGNAYGFKSLQDASPVIRNNRVTSLLGKHAAGIDLQGGTGLVRGNTIRGGEGRLSSYGMRVGSTVALVVENNDVSGGAAPETRGVFCQNAGLSMAVRGNTIDGGTATTASYGIYASDQCVIANNIILGGNAPTTRGFFVDDLSWNPNVRLLNNTIASGSGAVAYCVYTGSNITLANNILVGNASSAVGLYLLGSLPEPRIRYNDFDAGTLAVLAADYSHQYHTIAEVNALTDNNHFSIAVGNVDSGPALAGPASGDWHFTSQSPAAVTDGGEVLSGASLPDNFPRNGNGEPVDKDGLIRGAAWSMGAYENE